MHFFKEHGYRLPEVVLEIKRSELKMENLINKYRFFLITILMLGDVVVAHMAGVYNVRYLHYGLPAVVVIYFGLFKLHKLTKGTKPKPYLKYVTISIDYLFITIGVFEMRHVLPQFLRLDLKQLALLSAILFMVINSLSALRIQKKVIVISTVIGVIINTYIQNYLNSAMVILFYTNGFIFITGVFNIYISKYIYNFYATNFQLSNTLVDLSNANKEIKAKNEEINAQNDELATQNEYLAKQRDEISYQKKQLTSSIQYARRIQEAVLDTPEEIKQVTSDSFVYFKPKDIVSGDFYWFKNVIVDKKQYKVFTAVDCTGHGVPGGFMSMLGTSLLNEIAGEIKDDIRSAYFLNRLREEIKLYLHQESNQSEVKDGMDMALCILDYEEMQLQFSGANNALYIIRNNNGKLSSDIEEVKPNKMPIGVYIKEDKSFANNLIDVNMGDILYTFSDGFMDQFGGENGEKLKKRRFKEILLKVSGLPMDDQKQALDSYLKQWMGNCEQIDDITVVGVKV